MLRDKYTDSYHRIKVKKNGSTIKALSREARRSGDGTNPSLSIIDEYGNSHETNEIVDVQRSGMVARSQPLLIFITTAGFRLDFPCYSYYQYCADILNPETDTDNDTIFIAIYELDPNDDIKDESNWIKANPIVTTYEKGLESLRAALKIALDRPEEMRSFLTKNMNLWVDMKDEGYISMKKWNKEVVDEDYFKKFLNGANIYLGFDLSATTDLTSLGFVAVKDGKFLVWQKSYMPSEKYYERMSKDRFRFDLSVASGELTLTEGAVVDYNVMKHDIMDFVRQYNVKEIGFDPWNSVYFSTELLNEGLNLVEIPQSITKLTEPTKTFREKLYKHELSHLEDALLKWAVNNAVTQTDQNENIKLDKSKSTDRIDPIAAIINAFARAMYDPLSVDLNEIIMSDDWSF